MAVSKELLARYKELKAQGVNVTLSELKAQLEAENNNSNNELPVTEAPKPTGFAALSACQKQEPEPVQTYNEPTYNEPQQENSWSNSYYSQPEQPQYEAPTESYTSSFESAGSSMMQSSSIESYSYGGSTYNEPSYSEPQQSYYQEPQQPTYTEPQQTYYQEPVYQQPQPEPVYQQPEQTYYQPEPQPTYEQPQVQSQPYTGNVSPNNTVDTSAYNSNFNANFGWDTSTTQTTQTIEQPKAKYTGNLPPQPPSSFFGPSVVDEKSPLPNPLQQGAREQNKYCLIGYPLGHSLSSYIHNAGFKSIGIETEYEILETPPDDLVDRIKYLKYNGYAGFNVTIPLKLPVTLFLDTVDSSADLVGAVNTVVINQDKTLRGYNTDVIGFRNAIPADFNLIGKTAGVLGTGGAARAAIVALAQSQVKEIKIYTRNIPNCSELLNYLRRKFPLVEFNVYQIEYIRDLSNIQILVNTTPIGMQGRAADMTPVEENELKTLPQGALVYDVIYNPKKTILLKLAEKNGYRTINGVDMFIHQALATEEIWTGRTPNFKDMKIAALENL
ncbi:shikimate dehydrogenase [bacterium]|nr:shikimate dehydrogenase [bacterium]